MPRLSLFLLVCSLSPCSFAQQDTVALLASKGGMTGTFEQQIISPEGEQLESSHGQFSLQRPDKMRWQIESPDRQLLIAAGELLTQIDWDLEVVTERHLADSGRSILDWLLASKEELEAAAATDPIARFRLFLEKKDLWDDELQQRVEDESAAEATRMRDEIYEAPHGDPMELFEHVYVDPTGHYERQRPILQGELDAHAGGAEAQPSTRGQSDGEG